MGQDRAARHSLLIAGLTSLQLALNAQTVDKLLNYIELLAKRTAEVNLTAVRDPLQMVTRHLLDSLSIAKYVEGHSLIDIGSGAGLPGIPLALIAPQRQVLLVDSNGKKVRFLNEAVQTLELRNTRVVQQRIEQIKERFDCVTARAFATLPEMLKLGGHLLAPNGAWLAQKGRYPEAEIAAVPREFKVMATHKLQVPGLDAQRHLVVIRRADGQKKTS